eukprot:TRINITY_DN24884_c0_g1_i1.p1 TRINITY_DN24884_c0_g1~~TRINITY_DN24884_c0_g1_i1.p1  ORF type:complete len:848 (+),score=320.48 TRINITY_DN24884_c0_g1_i1:54-2597(+)
MASAAPEDTGAASEDTLIRQIYDTLPKNAEGGVSLKGLSGVIEKMRFYSVTMAPNILDDKGLSADDVLTYDEFKSNLIPMVEMLGLTVKDCLDKLQAKWLPDELAGLQELFRLVDVDGGGSITVDELTTMIQLLKPHATEADVAAAMAVADSDVSGDIDFDEFADFIATMKLDDPQNAGGIAVLEESIARLREYVTAQDDVMSDKGDAMLSPTEKNRRARLGRLASNLEATVAGFANELMAEEMAARRTVEDEEDEEWESVSSFLGRAIDEMATEERMVELARKRDEFMSGGADAQRADITAMREQRDREEAERRNRKNSESRYKLEDRINVCQTNMHCTGQQFKLLRQCLNKGLEQVKLEADREFGDLRRTIPARQAEISGSIDRVEGMLATVGRALMQESMARHGTGHKEVLRTFMERDSEYATADFTWLQGTHAASRDEQLARLKERSSMNSRLSALQVNFSDPCNLHATTEPPPMTMKVTELKKFLYACFRHYASDGGFGYVDFQKLLSDCSVDIAGSPMVMWHNAVNDMADCDVLGLRREGELDAASMLTSSAAAMTGKLDFRRFANLLLLVACERYIASPSSSAQYKLECFLLHELLPLLPQELLVSLDGPAAHDLPFDLSPLDIVAQLPTIHGLLEEHHHVIAPTVARVQDSVQRFLKRRPLTARARAEESGMLARGVLNAAHFMHSMGLGPLREPEKSRLPQVALSAECSALVRSLSGSGGDGCPVIPLSELSPYLAYQMPAIGRKLLEDAVGRSFNEVLAATYPTLSYPMPLNKLRTCSDPIPFPIFLALCAKTAMYTSIAAAVPPPAPGGPPLSAGSNKVRAFFTYLTHTGHYVLNL